MVDWDKEKEACTAAKASPQLKALMASGGVIGSRKPKAKATHDRHSTPYAGGIADTAIVKAWEVAAAKKND